MRYLLIVPLCYIIVVMCFVTNPVFGWGIVGWCGYQHIKALRRLHGQKRRSG